MTEIGYFSNFSGDFSKKRRRVTSETAEVAVAHVVDHDEDDVGAGRRPCDRKGQDSEQRKDENW